MADPSAGDTGRSHWIEIQRVTFTNWINEELKGIKSKHHEVKDIQTGFRDGLALLALLKELHTKAIRSNKPETKLDFEEENMNFGSFVQALAPVHEKPKNPFEMSENLKRCLHFMKEQKFYGIESTGKLNCYQL